MNLIFCLYFFVYYYHMVWYVYICTRLCLYTHVKLLKRWWVAGAKGRVVLRLYELERILEEQVAYCRIWRGVWCSQTIFLADVCVWKSRLRYCRRGIPYSPPLMRIFSQVSIATQTNMVKVPRKAGGNIRVFDVNMWSVNMYLLFENLKACWGVLGEGICRRDSCVHNNLKNVSWSKNDLHKLYNNVNLFYSLGNV